MSVQRTKELLSLVMESLIETRTVGPETLPMDSLGLKGPRGEPLVSETERKNPLEFLLLNHVARPLIGDVIPDEAPELVKTVLLKLVGEVAKAQDKRDEEVAGLKARINELEAKMRELNERVKNKKKKA